MVFRRGGRVLGMFAVFWRFFFWAAIGYHCVVEEGGGSGGQGEAPARHEHVDEPPPALTADELTRMKENLGPQRAKNTTEEYDRNFKNFTVGMSETSPACVETTAEQCFGILGLQAFWAGVEY